MPEPSAFTVLDREEPPPPGAPERERSVSVVRPVPRLPAPAPPPPPAASRALPDPKFSRALDFKLRRLEEKEALRANLRRPTRPRLANARLAASEPDVRDARSEASPRMEESPSPGRRSRGRKVSGPEEGERPRFVTTVRTGRFLPPPPELASLLGLESLYPQERDRDRVVYSYASRPEAVAARPRRAVTLPPPPRPPRPPQPPQPAGSAGRLFGGVRALVAGVAGLRHALELRDQPGSLSTAQYGNVMHDKRVVRGSTYAARAHAAGDGPEGAARAQARRRALARRAAAAAAAAARLRGPGAASPPPAPGRRHLPVQTEHFLEELFDKGSEVEVGVQTELLLERPASPPYVPAKTGADAHTQIYPGDLFDFDVEVQPILEVMVGKTAEQALAEVAQEEELAALAGRRRRGAELRDAARAERDRLRAADQRMHQEKERRVSEAVEQQRAAQEARSRAAAGALSRGWLADAVPAALRGLRAQGCLPAAAEGAADDLLPWLVDEVAGEIDALLTSRDLVTDIVRDVVETRAELYRTLRQSPPEDTPEGASPPPEQDLAGEAISEQDSRESAENAE